MRSLSAVVLDVRLVLLEPRLESLRSGAGEILGWSRRWDEGWIAAPVDRHVGEVLFIETVFRRNRLRIACDEARHGRTHQSRQVGVAAIGTPPSVVAGRCGVSELRRGALVAAGRAVLLATGVRNLA